MWRLHHVAAEVQHDLGDGPIARVRRARDARDEVRGELQAREHLHAARHRVEARLPGGAPIRFGLALIQSHARHRQHEARVDAVLAGAQTLAGAGARLGPARADALRIAGAAKDVEHVGHDRARIALVDATWLRGRTHFDAAAAARALLEDVGDPRIQTGDERGFARAHGLAFTLTERGRAGTIGVARRGSTDPGEAATEPASHKAGMCTAPATSTTDSRRRNDRPAGPITRPCVVAPARACPVAASAAPASAPISRSVDLVRRSCSDPD